MEAAVAKLQASGDTNVHLVQGHMLYGNDTASTTATFNNVHPTDLGHWKISEFYTAYLPTVIASTTPHAPAATNAGGNVSASSSSEPRNVDTVHTGGATGGVDADVGLNGEYNVAVESATDHRELSSSPPPPPLVFTDFADLEISGRGFNDTPSIYNRLPAAAQATARAAVWDLSLDSAGLSVRFETNAPEIYVSFTLRNKAGIFAGVHFPATGASGCDLYALDESVAPTAWKFVGSFAELNANTQQKGVIATNLPTNRSTAYRLYLPTYNSVTAGSIGVPQGSTLTKDHRPGFEKPAVVWYGTSILQGGVASRVGNAFTNMISRRLKQEIFNFGFSGKTYRRKNCIRPGVPIV